MTMIRRDSTAAVSVGILIGLIVIVAVMGFLIYTATGGSDGDYAPNIRLTLYRNEAQDVYRADMALNIDDASFIEHLWTGSVGGDGGLPEGDHTLKVELWKGELNDRKDILVSERTFKVGVPDESESTYVITMPIMQLEGEATSIHMWGYVYWDGNVIREASWSINPADGTMTEG